MRRSTYGARFAGRKYGGIAVLRIPQGRLWRSAARAASIPIRFWPGICGQNKKFRRCGICGIFFDASEPAFGQAQRRPLLRQGTSAKIIAENASANVEGSGTSATPIISPPWDTEITGAEISKPP